MSRWALYDALRSDIEATSDLRIQYDGFRGRETVLDLRKRLKLLGPILNQIGWEPESDREFFEVDSTREACGHSHVDIFAQ